MPTLFLIGRVLLGGYFLYNAYQHFKNLKGYTAYAQMKSVPSPKIAVIVSGVMLALGGLSIILGMFVILGMWLLVLFLLPTTFMMHKFWTISDPQMKSAERVQFMKNIALIGALLMLSSLFILLTPVS